MRTPRLRISLPLVLVLLWAGCAPQPLTPADYRDRLPALEARIVEAPTDADAFRDLGEAYAQLQRFNEAERVLRRAYEIDSDDPATLYYLGVAHEGLGNEADALFMLGQYERVSPDSRYRPLMEARHTWLRRTIARRELQALLVMEDEAAAARASDAVAVFPFIYRGTDPRFEVLGRGLGEMLTIDLASVEGLTVVERVRLQALLNELEFSQGDGFDPETAPRLGRLLQSGRIVGGSFDVLGERLQTDVVLWNWKDEPLPALSEHADDLDDLFRLEKEIAFSLINDLGITLSQSERARIEQIPTRDLQAFLAFSRGLREEDAGNFAAASAQFQQAARLDPGFSLAGQRAGAAQAMSSAAGPITAALGAGKTTTGGGNPQSSSMSDLVGARLDNLNQNIGAHVVPTEETRSAETPFEPPVIEPIPDPPPPPGGN
jgi:tetratricopeptide (TPR) repeat protein